VQPICERQYQAYRSILSFCVHLFPALPKLTWFELTWPQDTPAPVVNNLIRALSGNRSSYGLRFVVQAQKNHINHYVGLPIRHKQALAGLLKSFLTELELTACHPPEMTFSLVARLRSTSKNRQLAVDNPELTNHAILNALQNIGKQECLIFMWVLGRPRSPDAVANHSNPNITWGSAVSTFLTALIRPPEKLDNQAYASFRDKRAVPAFKANLLIGVTANNQPRRYQLLQYVIGALKSAEAPGVRFGLSVRHRLWHRNALSIPKWRWSLLVNTKELSCLLGWPLGSQDFMGVARITNRRLGIPANMPRTGRVIASSVLKDSHQNIRLSAEDALMHMHVIGPTGVGKSTLLLNLIVQDIQENRGVIVIDPKGDLVSEVLKRIPAQRKNDVVILDPSDVGRPVGLNPLVRPGQPANLVVDDILSIFRKLYGSYFGPRTEDILHAGLLTLASADNPSLCLLPLLYTNPALRFQLTSRLNDPLGLGSFWDWFETISDQQRNAALAPVMNKLRAFLLRPAMRQVLGQASPRFDITEALSQRKIFLVNLAKGTLGSEASQLFGSFVMAQVWQAIQTRANLPEKKRPLAFVYVDEVQDYLHLPTDIADVLVQARSYGVGMILAHQHLGQLTKDLKSALFANARSKVCFQLSRDDASIMAKNSSLLKNEDFENLGRFQIYSRMVINGRVSSWMSGKTLAPMEPFSNPVLLKKRSRQRYGCDAAEVEAGIFTNYASIAPATHPKSLPIGHKSGALTI
jgi:uncharacterized protein DUF87/type IV secretion system coupling TraD/TrwB family protein